MRDEDGQMGDAAHSLPPANGATGAEVLHAALPLIVRAASESASAATRAVMTQTAVESRLVEFKTALEENTTAIERWTDAKKRENDLRQAEIDAQTEGSKRWHKTVRSVITPQVVLQMGVQILTLLGIAFGLYQVMPTPGAQSATLPRADVLEIHPPSP